MRAMTKPDRKPKKKGDPVDDWSTRRDKDLRHCEAVAGQWLSFTLSKAPWITIASKAQLRDAFGSPVDMTDLESIDEWTTQVQQALCYYVLLDMIMQAKDRVQQFQALGRGWIFVLLAGNSTQRYSRVKIWFESSDRVLHDHEMDMRAAELVGSTRDKYLWGYNPEAEIVFFIKGLAPARPLVCIQRLRPDYRDLDKWAVKPETKIKCLDGKLPSDAERERVVKQHKRRKRQRNRERQKEREIRAGERVAIEQALFDLLVLKWGSEQTARTEATRLGIQCSQDLSTPQSSASSSTPSTPPPLNVIRSVRTPYGVGLLRKIRPDSTLVLEMQWGAHFHIHHTPPPPPIQPPLTEDTPRGTDPLVHPVETASENSRAASESPSSRHQHRNVTLMYVPAPYSAVSEIETWEEYETRRNWDRFESRTANTGDLFEQLLAETKAACVSR